MSDQFRREPIIEKIPLVRPRQDPIKHLEARGKCLALGPKLTSTSNGRKSQSHFGRLSSVALDQSHSAWLVYFCLTNLLSELQVANERYVREFDAKGELYGSLGACSREFQTILQID
ncbi:MAG: hypothetical protein WA645_16940 [Pseudolabrys sp.]